jgi:MOSC domain-containing protein
LTVGRVIELWRYPVSGLQGERLTAAQILPEGIEGDHAYVVRSKELDKVLGPINHLGASGETAGSPGMLDFSSLLVGNLQDDHSIIIRSPEGRDYTTNDSDLNDGLSNLLHHRVEVIRYSRMVESRVLSGRTLHLLTTSSLEQMRCHYPQGDFDVRRFRPNIVVSIQSGLAGFVEEGWVGKNVMMGDSVELKVEKPNTRCSITTMSQAGIREDQRILQTIERVNERKLGVMCTVVRGGMLSVGDEITVE